MHAKDLFVKNWNGDPVRLLGVTANEVIEAHEAMKQLDLFSYTQDVKEVKLESAVNAITRKFGSQIIKKGIKIHDKDAASNTSFSKDFLHRPKDDGPYGK